MSLNAIFPQNRTLTEGPGFVKCILPRRSMRPQGVLEEFAEQQLTKLLLITSELKAADVIRYLSVSRATATRLLAKIVEQGKLIKIGQGSATKYRKTD